MEVNFEGTIFQHGYDSRIFEVNLSAIVSEYGSYEDYFVDRCFGDNFKIDSYDNICFKNNIFEIKYFFTYHFIIEKDKIFLENIKCQKQKRIMHFDDFTYPEYLSKKYVLYKCGDEKFILDLINKKYFYVTGHDSVVLSNVLNKLNKYDILAKDTQGHGQVYFFIGDNRFEQELFETFFDYDSDLLEMKVHIF
jgi:hypothetical protein